MSYRLKVTENLLSEKSHLVTGQSIKKQKQNKKTPKPPKTLTKSLYKGASEIPRTHTEGENHLLRVIPLTSTHPLITMQQTGE